MDDIKKFCFDYFETTLSVEYCLEIFISSVTYNNPSPLNKTLDLISNNFDVISKKHTFKSLSKRNLDLLLSKLHEHNVREESMFKAVLNWVKHNEDRRQYFALLLLTFDLCKFSDECIKEKAAVEPLVKENIECVITIMERLIRKPKETRKKGNAPKILSVGGENNSSILEVYNIHTKSDIAYPELSVKALSNHCLVIPGDLFCCAVADAPIAEHYNLNPQPKIFLLKMTDQNPQWKQAALMQYKRSHFGATSFGKHHIIVAGGYNNERLKSAELLDVRLNAWKTIAALNYSRSDLSLAVADGSIFAIGGHDGYGFISTVEKLHDLDGQWKKFRPMNTLRRSHAAVSCDLVYVYVIGGGSKQTRANNTVEMFDQKKNEWSYVASMSKERRFPAACVLQGKIFVVGGKDGDGEAVKSIECYDTLLDQWSIVGEVSHKLAGHALFTLNDKFQA